MIKLAPLAVLLPFLGAAITFVLAKYPQRQRVASLVVMGAMTILAVLLLITAEVNGAQVSHIGGWVPPWGITLVIDRLSALLLLVSMIVSFFVLIFAVGQGAADGDRDTPISIFHPTYLILLAGVSNAFLAGDLFNLYVGFEILLAASYVLMTIGGTGPRIRAGVTYIVVNLLSSMLFLASIALIYTATGTLNMADLSVKLAEIPPEVQLGLHTMLIVAFGIKAAIFPLSFWLPDSYPTATAPVTAVFAGLLTKVGVYAIIRTETLLFPGGAINGLLMVIAIMTMLVGIMGAIAQTDIKRILSFTLVSHIGYMIFGIALGTVAALAGVVFYIIHHIIAQTTLFLTAGLIERRGGSTNIDRLGGLAKLAPFLGFLFFIPALNLGGIPPFSGFLAKTGLLQAGVADGSPLSLITVAVAVLVSLFTLYALVKIWNRAFWRTPEQAEHPDPVLLEPVASGRELLAAKEQGETVLISGNLKTPRTHNEVKVRTEQGTIWNLRHILPWSMVWSTVAMVAVGISLTVFATPLYGLAERAALDMHDRQVYVEYVLNNLNRQSAPPGQDGSIFVGSDGS